jgi:hypothetical protein
MPRRIENARDLQQPRGIGMQQLVRFSLNIAGQFVDMHTIFALLLILLSSVLSGLTDLSFTLNGYPDNPVRVNHALVLLNR